jgi:hypothetical protein
VIYYITGLITRGDCMNEVEALAKIQGMSIDEKIAALSPTDKA